MATREELFEAVRLLKTNCENPGNRFCSGCPLFYWCYDRIRNRSLCTPRWWADPEECSKNTRNIIQRTLSAEVEEVVHCKDCINWNGNDCITIWGIGCPKPNDYCSRGERLDNGSKTN